MTMKMRSFITLLAVVMCASASAQISLGVQGGAVFSKPNATLVDETTSLQLNAESRTGFSAGVIADIPFGESGFRLIPELQYVSKGLTSKSIFSLQQTQLGVDLKSTIAYMELPLNFAYAFNVGDHFLMLGAGPYAAFGINGRSDYKITIGTIAQEDKQDVVFGNASGEIKRFDFGANAMAAFILDNGLMIKANYSLGLANISNDAASPYKNSYFGVSLGYFFLRGGR
jgi:hypothetical protein